MGAAASTEADSNLKQIRATFLDGKPLDASDIKSLSEAKDEIIQLRELASKALSNDGAKRKNDEKVKRPAVMEKSVENSYVMKTIPKSEQVKKLIHDAIKPNILFRTCSEEELADLIDAFESSDFEAQSTVIQQGGEGEHFYVVESGSLDITVRTEENKEGSNEVHVGVPYMPGAAFGELALMYGSPRAATIRAKESCKLWCIDRRAFRGITGQHKKRQAERQFDFLRNVKIGDKILGDVLKVSDLDAMSLATQKDTFRKGDVIVREGERGDIFYLIESGSVDVFKKNIADNKAITTLTTGQFFGERALLTEDVRQATCIATSEVQCLYLMRQDFNLMLGDLQDLLDGNVRKEDESFAKLKTRQDKQECTKHELSDLQVLGTLGVGAFGHVKLVKDTKHVLDSSSVTKESTEPDNGKPKADTAQAKTYALKVLSKSSIVDSGLQEHVMTEKKIMEKLNHPFILTYHCAMQDDKYIYFLLEVLLGGELFKVLRAETQFSETWSRFYTASVLLAFREMHSKKIAYRDLKPENLVMDSNGFLKLVDFGLAKQVDGGKTWTLCGTPDYLAPEVILNEGHDWAVDYWALGVLIYEMTAGSPPFYADDPMEVYEKILSGHVSIPPHFSRGISDLVKKLLRTYQSKRLGRTRGGTSAVMKHKWFSGFDWDALMNKTMNVPLKPKVKNMEDMSNFDFYGEEDSFQAKPCPDWTPEF